MVLAEVLTEMKNLRHKVAQLENYLFKISDTNAGLADEATTKLLDLMDKYRSHLIMVNMVNNNTLVTVGEQRVSLANAVIIAKTIKKKINLLNSLIEEDNVLDKFDLMKQRDALLGEYDTLANSLKAIEWRTEVD